MKIYGLTGGIGSGKSTAMQCFQDAGAEVLDTDQLARDVIAPGTEGARALEEAIGGAYFVDGALNRSQLRTDLYQDPALKERVESVIHARVADVVHAWRNEPCEAPYRILCSPLLLERRDVHPVDAVIIVDLPESLQIERAMQRDGASEAQIRAIVAAQMDRSSRLEQADFILNNATTREALASQVDALHRTFTHEP